jgi:hypothetical protein
MLRTCLVVLLLAPSPAAGADQACVVAHASAVEREEAGRHREARELFASCAKEACGPSIWQECTEGLRSLSDLPTMIPSITDEKGEPLTDVEVWMERELLTSKLDGSAIAVEPGLHEISFSKNGEVIATRKIVIKEGKSRHWRLRRIQRK